MIPLNSQELTGRASTHVLELPGHATTRLHPQVHEPLARLREAAAAAGIELEVVSGFRDFERQSGIWNGKFRGERPALDRSGQPIEMGKLDEAQRVRSILIWSALPGASRHHWGTDFDVIDRAALASLAPGYRVELTVEEFTGTGPFVRLNEWLAANMANHGFFRPYTTDRGGVRPEPWHLSFAPVSVPALESFTLEMLKEAVEGSELAGRETVLAQLPDLYERYVRSVNSP
jgi:LAS superfamily LD-carboxypeptidase LdcB